LKQEAWELCTLFDINVRPKQMSIADLQAGFLKLGQQLYSAAETTRRRRKFRTKLRTSANARRNRPDAALLAA
jgi:hypothetical protein